MDVLESTENAQIFEEENQSDDEEIRHKKLLNSLGIESKNDEGKKLHKDQRSEATNDVSIYSLGARSKVKTHDLVNNLKSTVNINLLKKSLSKVENSKNQLAPLLPKISAEKVEREAAYESTTEKVSRWDDIVKRNRNAEHLSFPLKHETLTINTVDDFVQRFKPKTPLEQQIYALLKGNKYEERSENGLSVAEEEALKSTSIQEARRRRAELQKHRALLSYHEAKNRRLGKIKSRRHLRIIRKQKEKKSVAEFEEFQRKDPEGAAAKMEQAEKTRAEERAILRHRQGSKWAKNRMLMAKYDESTKIQLGEQKKLHSELVQKNLTKIENSDEDSEDDDNDGTNSTVAPTSAMQTIYLPKNNPWLIQGDRKQKMEDNNNENIKETEKEQPSTRRYTRSHPGILGLETVSQQKQTEDDSSESEEEDLKSELLEIKQRKKFRDDMQIVENIDEVAEESIKENDVQEESINNFKAALANLRKEDKKIVKNEENNDESESENEDTGMEITTNRRKTLQDLEKVLNTEEDIMTLSDLHQNSQKKTEKKNTEITKLEYIDPSKVFTMPAKIVSAEEPTLVEDEEEIEGDSPNKEDANRMTIREAFADDDVMAEFMAEKERNISASKPKAIDLTLPGWGEWGGIGLKPSRRRRKKFFIKPRPPPPRKDQHLGSVIINEKRDVHLVKHQVNQVPFPFTSDEQYQRSIRQPVGKTWNTPSTFKKLTQPKVTTIPGAIIQPMDEDDAFDNTKPQRRKRVMDDEGNIGFNDVTDTTIRGKRYRRSNANKKHKK